MSFSKIQLVPGTTSYLQTRDGNSDVKRTQLEQKLIPLGLTRKVLSEKALSRLKQDSLLIVIVSFNPEPSNLQAESVC